MWVFLERILAVVLVCGSLSVSALANTDHRCLNNCVSQGTVASSCLQTCTYDSASPLVVQPRTAGNNPFTALTRVSSDEISLAPVSTQSGAVGPQGRSMTQTGPLQGPGGRYQCLAQCVQSGLMNDICRRQCGMQGP
jgi:hypothetical protein